MESRDNFRECLCLTLQTDHKQIIDELVRRSEFVRKEKGTKLFREGEVIRDCYFLLDGVVRMFFTDAEGEEITEWINFEPGAIIHPSYKLCDGNTAKASSEAVTECELAHIPLDSLLEVMELYPEFEHLRVRVLQDTLGRQAILKRSLTHKSPSERYDWFVETWPELAGRVPQKYIASFLGMTPVSLSRIRSRYRDKQTEE